MSDDNYDVERISLATLDDAKKQWLKSIMSGDEVTSETCYDEIEKLVSSGQWFGDATIARIANEWDLQCRHVAMIARRVIEAQSNPSRTFRITQEQFYNDPLLAGLHCAGATEAEVIDALYEQSKRMRQNMYDYAARMTQPLVIKFTADQIEPLAQTPPDRR